MTMTFKNPSNGYTEEVGTGSSAGVFFFGAIYLAIKGLWMHVFIWLLVVGIPTVASGGPVVIFALPIVSICYALTIQGILRSDYLRRGWKEITDPSEAGAIATPPMSPVEHATKTCPFCAEEVLAAAIKCKHCGSDLVGENMEFQGGK